MKAITKFMAAGAAVAALGVAAPAAAQMFPGYGMPGYGYGMGGYGSPYGYGYAGGARVLGISRVEPGLLGAVNVHGVATTGRYGYGSSQIDLTWKCKADPSGAIVSIDVFELDACQLVKSQGGPVAQSVVALPLIVKVPATSITAVPVYVADCDTVMLPSMKIEPLIVSRFVELSQVSWPVLEPLCEMHE